jgi:hypothetical protein
MNISPRRRLAAALTVLAIAASAHAAPSAQGSGKGEGRDCFRAADVDSWAPADYSTVNIKVNFKRYYQLKLAGDCRDIDWSQRIGIEHRGSSWICSSLDATLIVPSPIGPRRCPVIDVKRLSPEEVAALPRRAKP